MDSATVSVPLVLTVPSVDTHAMDGQWQTANASIISHPLYTQALQIVQEGGSRQELDKLKAQLSQGQGWLQLIQSGQGNTDCINHADALPLLIMCSLLLDSVDKQALCKLLGEQLQDMSTGGCPQGRTTRLAQLVNSFI